MPSRLVGDSWAIARPLGTLRQVVSDTRSDAPVTNAVLRESLDAVGFPTIPGQTAPVGGVDTSGEVAERSPVVRREVPARAPPEQNGRREHEGQDQSHIVRQGYRY